jgi:uncharacterized protein
MAACLIGGLLGAPLRGVPVMGASARTILGVAVGASITPATLAVLPTMALSVALVPLYIIVIAAIGVPYFRRVCGYDPITAWYAAMPGGLADMVQFGKEAGGNGRSLSLIHATRILIIVTIAPMILVWWLGASLDNPVGVPATDIPLLELGLMVAAALIGWKGGERIGLIGATILGPMIVAGMLSLAGLIHYRPPAEAVLFAQFFIGVAIGSGYTALTLTEFRRDVLSGTGFVLILAAVATAFSVAVISFGFAEPLEAFLAFSPAGQAEMAVLAIVVGADIGFVVVHHLLRLVLVIVGAPLVSRTKSAAQKRR